MGDVVKMFESPSCWKEIFTAFPGDVAVHVYVNSHTGAVEVVLLDEIDGESITAHMSAEDSFALSKHLSAAHAGKVPPETA